MKKNTKTQVSVVKSSSKAKKELQRIGESLKGKVLFKEKLESAKKTLAKLKSLPI